MSHSLEDNPKHKGLRKMLVEQLKKKGITNMKVLEAMQRVPRHYFFDSAFLTHAYQDKAFSIGEGQTISQPYTVAFQTSLLDVQKGDKILEIGTGSGYQTCILLELGAKVYTIEYNQKLYEKAKEQLTYLRYKPTFFHKDGSLGLPAYAPFNKILVTAGAPAIPESLIKQLQIGGKLVIPVGDEGSQKMLLITKKDENTLEQEAFHDFVFVPLLGKNGWGN